MTIEAGINGPIIEEAKKGKERARGIVEGREKVPAINAALNELIDTNVLRDAQGKPVHDGRGWSKITVCLKTDQEGVTTDVNVVRHVRSRRVDLFVEGLDTTMHIGTHSIQLATVATVPQRPMSFSESMRVPAGSSTPNAPAYEQREATLEEVGYIEDFVNTLTNPELVERIGNKLPH